MRRRAFFGMAVGAVFAWPLAAGAQGERVRRVGMLLSPAETDSAQHARNAAFRDRMHALGWREGHDLVLDVRWARGDPALFRRYAGELVAASPDVIVAMSRPAIIALRERTATIPIVFQFISDPVAQGFVQSLAHPGGNVTGFANFEHSLGGKWLQILKDLVPATSRVLVLYNRDDIAADWRPGLETTAPSLPIDLHYAKISNIADLPVALAAFAKGGGGVLVLPDPFPAGHRNAYIAAMAAARLPAIYTNDAFARAGALVSYGPDILELFAEGADMVHRILRGESPANIPVRTPSTYRLVINAKVAKALGIPISESMLLRADEVVE